MSDWNLNVEGPLDGISPYEKHPPRFLGLADQFAKYRNKTADLQGLMYNARELGMDVDTQDKIAKEQRLAELVQKFTETTKDLDDTEYQKAAQDFAQKMGASMPQRQQAELQQVSPLQAGLSILGMALNPQFAGDIGAATLQSNVNERTRQQGINDQDYDDRVQRQNRDTQGSKVRMDIADNNLDRQYQQQARVGQGIEREIQFLRGEIGKLDAKKQQEIRMAWDLWENAETTGSKYRYGKLLQQAMGPGSKYAPSDEDIAVSVAQMRAAEVEASRVQKEKRDGGVIDDFTKWASSNFPAGASISPEDADIINGEAKRISERFGVDLDKFPMYFPRESEAEKNRKFNEGKYKEGNEDRKLDREYKRQQISKIKADIEKINNPPPKPSKDKVERQRQVSKLTDDYQKYRRETDALMLQVKPEDPEELAKYNKALQDAFAKEFLVLRDKRAMAGQRLTFVQYMAERFPQVKRLGGRFGGKINDKGRGTSQQGIPPVDPVGNAERRGFKIER
jgi:hypothetical protein